jgi:putative spermidine/putrescine transport system substrate-binding protein
MDALIAAAKAEGHLSLIGMPHNWCGYEAIIDGFKRKYPGIAVNELNPDATSGDQVEAIKVNKGNSGAQAPDLIDVGLSFGRAAKADSLLMPYKVSTWDSIPDAAKDPEGYWTGDYYGVLSFAVNRKVVRDVPTDWADLLKGEHKNTVALAGDPRSAYQAIQSVHAAGLSKGAEVGKAAGTAGLDFFNELNAKGNFVPIRGTARSLAQGQTPILITWDYNALDIRDSLNGDPPVDVVIPKTSVVAGVYLQAISAYAPHPNAAKLWMEYLYSDDGQLGLLRGYCHPIRFNDLARREAIPADLSAKTPPAAAYEAVIFPTLAEQQAARDLIVKNWDAVVGADVK